VAHEVADRVYRLGAELVNWFIIEDGGKLTVVDTGLVKHYEQLPAALTKLGKWMSDVEAVVLTHAHGDHSGSAAQITDISGAPVLIHGDDAAMARGEAKHEPERHFIRDMTHKHAWKVLIYLMRNGVFQVPPVHELVEFEHGQVLDVPGRPRVIHTPGRWSR
jgi:glyoxylase-like metal-dependent hydrolase (beta-lactamase superfamily II)